MKKRLGIISILLLVIIVVTGCAASPQKQFVKQIESNDSNNMNAGSFAVSIADLELSSESQAETNNAAIGMVMSQVKNMKFEGDYQVDAKDKNIFEMKMKFDMMGIVIPLDIYANMGKDPEMYMSTNFMSSIAEIAQAFGGQEVPDLSALSSLEGKYLDIIELQESADTLKKQSVMDKEAIKVSEDYSKAYRKEAVTYIKSLDKKSFTKKDDTITHTFTKKEIIELLNLTQKVAKSDDKFKEYVASKDTSIEDLFKEVKDLTIKMQVDAKTDTIKLTIKLSPTNAEKAGVKSMTLNVKMKYSSNKKTVKMPKKADIISKDEMEELFGAAGAPGAADLSTGAVSDEDFEEIKAEMLEYKDLLDEEMIAELLTTYETILSEAQLKELEAIFK